jgi:uncharacterized protein (TIGR02594 family)
MVPAWVMMAKKYLGLKEVPGKENNPTIVLWLIQMKAWWRDDATPWCGTFVDNCFREAGIAVPAAGYRAKAWLNWGRKLEAPAFGCVVVFNRQGGGHVGFVVGRDARGRLIVRGGNQGDMVSDAPFDTARVAGYRWPLEGPEPEYGLPLILSSAPSSTREA